MGSVGNPMLFGHYFRDDEFVDVLFACPKNKTAKKTEKCSETTCTLIIEETYISTVTRFIEQAKQLEGEPSKKDTIDIPDHEIGSSSNSNRSQEEQSKQEGDAKTPISEEINRILDNVTPETETIWVQALEDVKNFKCQTPVRVNFFEHPKETEYKIYIAGFEVSY